MNTENLSILKIHKLSQEQYNRELAAGNIESNSIYLVPDEMQNIIDNTTISSPIQESANPITSNTLKNALNRTTSVAAADTNYTTYMARGMTLNSSATNPTINGTIAWTYE